jgi:hypothetical protein
VLLFCNLSLSSCMDLDVTNINEPDSERARTNPGDVESLIEASYNTWFQASHAWSPGFFLSAQTFQHGPPYTNWGMEYFSRIPRVATITEVTHSFYPPMSWGWEWNYKAVSALADGLKALENPEVVQALGQEQVILYQAYGRFVQGLTHGTVALLYARGFVLDETTDLTVPQDPVDYPELMEAALAYLDDAIQIASANTFTIPFDYMQADLDSQGLVRLAYSLKARFRAEVARTPEERAAVDWGAVIADVDRGIQSTHTIYMDWDTGWYSAILDYLTFYGWTQLPYFMYGMADQSGLVAEWLALPLSEKRHLLPDGRPVLIVTPDLRFPQGSTIEEQRENEGRFFRIVGAFEEGGYYSSWKRPDRGTWRWSWYKPGHGRAFDYYELNNFNQPEMTLEEMRLLKAEGLYRTGNQAEAAAIVNETRVAAGLEPTDASGTNPSCVPRLPDGTCGDLWEMLKWEKRMETVFTGIAGSSWFFDGRGWGDLWKDTPLQLPIPCLELEVLNLLPCTTFGGPGGVMGSEGSTYRFPGEG